MNDILNNRLIKTESIDWKKLVPFQPDNLKKTDPHKLQKLVNSLCENGFSMNFYVWEKDDKIYIIDGHSRHEVLQLIESGGIYPRDPSGKEYAVTIPEKLPCSFLHLKNKTEAKKAVLIYNSKYKNIDSDILKEWVSDLNIDEIKSQIEIPELDFGFEEKENIDKELFKSDNETEEENNIYSINNKVIFNSLNLMGIPELFEEDLYEYNGEEIYTYHSLFGENDQTKTPFYNFQTVSMKNLNASKSIIGFYGYDYKIEKLYFQPENYLQNIADNKFKSVITPNYSLYEKEPRVMRIYKTYQSRWVGKFLSELGMKIIPDIEFSTNYGDWEFVVMGLPKKINIASMQNQQGFRDNNEKELYFKILDKILEEIEIKNMIFYGEKYFPVYRDRYKKINFINIKSVNEVIRHAKRGK